MATPTYVRLPWTKPPLSLNDRRHWTAHAREVSAVRHAARVYLKRAGFDPRGQRVKIQLGWTPATRRRADTDNAMATLKVIADAAVDIGLVPDDVPLWMAKPEPIITAPSKDPHLWIELSTTAPYVEEPAR